MESEGSIYCNLRSCYKLLDDGYAWVTSCSHIFCAEDGEKIFKTALVCPCCNKKLDSKIDLVRIKLKPTEQYCNMILCGQRPHVIMDICTKGLLFWFNQLKQENDFIQYMIEKEREKRLNSEKYVESDCYFKVKQLQNKIDELKKENDNLKKLLNENKAKNGQNNEKLAPPIMQQLYNKPLNFNNNLDKDACTPKKSYF